MKQKIMIIGEIKKDEKTIRLNTEINCTNCGKTVPGGIKISEKYSVTNDFKKELEEFKKKYLCGICRDKKRVNKSSIINSNSNGEQKLKKIFNPIHPHRRDNEESEDEDE